MGRVQGLPDAQSARSQGQCHAVLLSQPGAARRQGGATYISPFVGRLEDLGLDGIALIREIRTIYDNDKSFKTKILASSIRSPLHVKLAAMAGADVATIPPGVLRNLAKHPLTDKGLEAFLADWKKTGQAIL